MWSLVKTKKDAKELLQRTKSLSGREPRDTRLLEWARWSPGEGSRFQCPLRICAPLPVTEERAGSDGPSRSSAVPRSVVEWLGRRAAAVPVAKAGGAATGGTTGGGGGHAKLEEGFKVILRKSAFSPPG